MIVKALREGLGRLIVLINFVSRPKKLVRSPANQEAVDKRAAQMALYQFYACPFCVLVRREIHRLNLPIVIRDAQTDTPYRQELLDAGGKVQVPCLRIEEDGKQTWMYESKEIIAFLKKSFDPEEAKAL